MNLGSYFRIHVLKTSFLFNLNEKTIDKQSMVFVYQSD